MGVTRAVNVAQQNLREVMTELGMTEGFDVGLEMSGAPPAFRTLLETMNHGGRIALLGIPPGEMSIDWNQVIFKGLFIKGFTAVRCLKPVQNGRADSVRPRSDADHHASLSHRRLPAGLRRDAFRAFRQSGAELGLTTHRPAGR